MLFRDTLSASATARTGPQSHPPPTKTGTRKKSAVPGHILTKRLAVRDTRPQGEDLTHALGVEGPSAGSTTLAGHLSDPILTPSDVHRALTQLMGTEFNRVWVRGEIVNVSPKTRAGHVYFDLKDVQGNKLSCTLFQVDQTVTPDVQARLVNGVLVTVRGAIRLSCKYRGSQYQCNVREVLVEADETGVYEKQLAEWRRALEAEGVFETSRKQHVPDYPNVVAVVTSEGGAALHDVRQTLRDAAAPFELRVYSCTMQGATCVRSVLDQLERIGAEVTGVGDAGRTEANRCTGASASHRRPDIVLITRGGGSREDLAAFNEPALIRGIDALRAIGQLPPVISAIGHQIDTPLLDLVCDRACITPTCAAQTLASPFSHVRHTVATQHQQVRQRLQARARELAQRCARLAYVCHSYDVCAQLRNAIAQKHQAVIARLRARVTEHAKSLHTLHQECTGAFPWAAWRSCPDYAVMRREDGSSGVTAAQLQPGKRGTMRLLTAMGDILLHYRVGSSS